MRWLLFLLLLSAPAAAATLLDAVESALAHSPRLTEARARVEEATYAIDEALAPTRPQLGLNAAYQRITPTVELPFATIIEEHNYLASLRLAQTLADFGRGHWAREAAERTRRATRFELEDTELELVQDTALAFLETLLAHRALEVAADELKSRTEQLEVSGQLFEAGAVARFDVVRSRAELAGARQRLLQAQNRHKLARARLDSLTGTSTEAQDTLVLPPPPEDPAPNLDIPELQALRSGLEAQKARVHQAESQDNPRLALQSEYQRRNPTGFSNDQQWTVTLQLEVPIFDGGLTEARTAQAESRATQLEARLAEAERLVRLRTEDAFLTLTTRWNELEVTEEKLEQATEAQRISELRYRNGLATLVELLDAESALTAARVDAARARYDYAAAMVAWGRVTGRLFTVLEEMR